MLMPLVGVELLAAADWLLLWWVSPLVQWEQ